ncbi:hypothetical protein L208DRAFT_1375358 [Tricholoma matsutake]|nr:hypothetical protein L208DRAFT_1375358 [Tricholoma matsutake 945]
MASVMDTSFLELIITTYQFAQKNYPDVKSLSHIRKVGDKLQDGTYMTVVLPPPAELVDVLEWCLLSTTFPLIPEDGAIAAHIDILKCIVIFLNIEKSKQEKFIASHIVQPPAPDFQMTISQKSTFLPVTQERHLSKTGTAQKHAPSDLKSKEVTAKSALSQKVLKDKQEESSESEDKEMESRAMASDEDGKAAVVVKKHKLDHPGKAGMPAMEFFEEAKTLGRAEWHKRLDFAILLLICAAGLPTYLVSRPEWQRVCMIADSTYTPATRERLETEQIVNEAENVAAKQREFLKMQENLTISCDGGTSKGREAFWTIHISTSPKRKVYLMECREATSESHTGVWIKNFVLEVIDSIGHAKFCAVVWDSTGNTHLSRRLLVLKVPTALNLADIVHHISNTLKDIIKLKYFENSIKVVRGIITKFHMSHLGMAELKVAHKVLHTGPGLEATGKTRFGTTILSARSVQRSITTIKKVMENGSFDLEVAYLKSDLFKSEAEDNDSYAGIHHIGTFKKVAQFLVDLAEKEIKHGDKEAFTVWQNLVGAFKAQFLSEFKAYTCHQYPFNLPVDEKKGVLRWWSALLGSDSTVILPVNAFLP